MISAAGYSSRIRFARVRFERKEVEAMKGVPDLGSVKVGVMNFTERAGKDGGLTAGGSASLSFGTAVFDGNLGASEWKYRRAVDSCTLKVSIRL